MEPFIGEVRLMPIQYVPQGWELCVGQTLLIQEFAALYSIIGTTFGGNGQTTFQLPDLRDRVVPGAGQGPGLRNWPWGMTDGEDAATLLESEMPHHNHGVNGLDDSGDSSTPEASDFLAQDSRAGGKIRYLSQMGGGVSLNTALDTQAMGISGESQAHENRQPFLTLNFCIATEGVYPSRS